MTPPKSRTTYLVSVLIFLALAAAVASALPTIKTRLASVLEPKNRTVLSKLIWNSGPDQPEYLIFKVRDRSGLQIEIYEQDRTLGTTQFRQNFILSQDRDAYLTIDLNTTNLALSDVDKDGLPDILAPSVDRNGNLRLNAFKFNADLKLFQIMENKTY